MNKRLGIFLLLIVFCIVGNVYYDAYTNSEIETTVEAKTENLSNVSDKKIVVYIEGAVAKPGFVSLNDGGKLSEIIEAAGGLLANADTKNLNLNETVKDGQKIIIYPRRNSILNENSELININTATIEELEKLPRIGPSTAKKIIEFREQNGKFKTIEDIKNVPRIGEKTFEKLKDKIKV